MVPVYLLKLRRARKTMAGAFAALSEERRWIILLKGMVESLNGQRLCKLRPAAKGTPRKLLSDRTLLGPTLYRRKCLPQNGERT